MKAELRHVPHSVYPGAFVVEVWHDGKFIATVVGADGPGVRIVSKYPTVVATPDEMVTEVWLELEGK